MIPWYWMQYPRVDSDRDNGGEVFLSCAFLPTKRRVYRILKVAHHACGSLVVANRHRLAPRKGRQDARWEMLVVSGCCRDSHHLPPKAALGRKRQPLLPRWKDMKVALKSDRRDNPSCQRDSAPPPTSHLASNRPHRPNLLRWRLQRSSPPAQPHSPGLLLPHIRQYVHVLEEIVLVPGTLMDGEESVASASLVTVCTLHHS